MRESGEVTQETEVNAEGRREDRQKKEEGGEEEGSLPWGQGESYNHPSMVGQGQGDASTPSPPSRWLSWVTGSHVFSGVAMPDSESHRLLHWSKSSTRPGSPSSSPVPFSTDTQRVFI